MTKKGGRYSDVIEYDEMDKLYILVFLFIILLIMIKVIVGIW